MPTRARYVVILFAVTLAIITYIDRVSISNAMPFIAKDLGLTDPQKGYVLSAFAAAYALFEVPGGWLADTIGPRKVLMRIVVWWSFFTAATGWTFRFWQLIVVRFLFGAGEAGAFPSITKAFSTWLPHQERVRAQGILWMSARWGGAFTPPLILLIFQYVDWRRAFAIFGGLGIIWAIFFYRWFRDNPRDHPGVNAAEAEIIGATVGRTHERTPWRRFLASRSVWLLWLQYFCLSYGWYFYITWLPTYLQEGRGLTFTKSAVIGGIPLFLGGIGSMVSGLLTPFLGRSWNDMGKSRRTMASIGMFSAGVLVMVSTRIADPVMAVVAMGLASFANDLTMPPAWGACMDVGGKYAGTLSGSMNMMGNMAGIFAPTVIGHILAATGRNWDVTFLISGVIYIIGSIAWLFIDPVTPIQAQAEVASSR